MSNRHSYWLPLEVDGDQQHSSRFRFIMLATRILFYPVYLLFVAVDKLSGQERWYRAKAEEMEGRQPFTDDDAQRDLNLSRMDAETWCSIRRAVAKAIGIRADAIYPSDKLTDLMRMQFPDPDLMDFIFHIEMELERPVPRGSLGKQLTADSTYLEFSTQLIDTIRCRPESK
jgi:hypothetical protein